MNPNSQNANVPELLSQVEDQALSPGRAAIFNTKVNLQAATATSRVFTELGLKYRGILTPVNSPSEIRRSFGMMSQSGERRRTWSRGVLQSCDGRRFRRLNFWEET
jgi:hypothetical protein